VGGKTGDEKWENRGNQEPTNEMNEQKARETTP